MPLNNYYNSGTVSVTNGSTAVTGSTTVWAALVLTNDIFEANGLTVRIASVTDNTHIVLAEPWPGSTISAHAYEIRFPPPSADITPTIRALIESLNDGLISQLDSISFSDGDFITYDGGTSQLVATTASEVATLIFAAAPDGTHSLPAIAFSSDPDTGIFRVGSGDYAFVSNTNIIAEVTTAGFGIRSTGTGAFDLIFKNTENLTASHGLTVTINNADRALNLGGDFVTTSSITLTGAGATNVSLPLTGTLATLAGAETPTNKTFNASNNTVTNLTTAMFASSVVDTDGALAANSDTRLASQKAVKTYVDQTRQGLFWKDACQAASTANVTVSSAPSTLDGKTLASGNRLLLKNQTTTTENGVYVYTSTGSALTRATDCSTGAELWGATVMVEAGGTVNTTISQWGNNNTSVPTIGSTAISFSQISGAGTYAAGTGLNLSAGTFSVPSNAITYALMQQASASRLLGNATGSTANVEEISLGAALSFSGTALQTAAMTGDVTASSNSFATTVAKIAGTVVSGTTGSTNVVFSSAPTISAPVISGNMSINNYSEAQTAATISTATQTVDLSTTGIFFYTLGHNVTLTFSNAPASTSYIHSVTFWLIQDGTGSRTVTWPANVKWPGGAAPTLSTSINTIDIITLQSPDGGTTWYGGVALGSVPK